MPAPPPHKVTLAIGSSDKKKSPRQQLPQGTICSLLQANTDLCFIAIKFCIAKIIHLPNRNNSIFQSGNSFIRNHSLAGQGAKLPPFPHVPFSCLSLYAEDTAIFISPFCTPYYNHNAIKDYCNTAISYYRNMHIKINLLIVIKR